MGHHEDDPSSSCYIKQEPDDGEGIYASTERERSYSEIFSWDKTIQGLTLQPNEQSSDPRPPHAVRSLTGTEMQSMLELLGFVPEPEPEQPSQRDDSFVSAFPDDEPQLDSSPSMSQQLANAAMPRPHEEESSVSRTPSLARSDCFASALPPRIQQKLSDLPAPRPEQREKSISRTPSPAQSNCFVSGPQTPERSQTPPTPVDHENALDLFGDDGEGQDPSTVNHPQRPLVTDAIPPQIQNLGESLQATQRPSQKITTIDLSEELETINPSSFGNGRSDNALRASTAWNSDTPIPSIERNPRARPQATTTSKPHGSQAGSNPNATSAPGGNRDSEHTNFAAQHGLAQKSESFVKKSEAREKQPAHKRSRGSAIKSSPAQLNPSASHFFSTFMKLRNSLPISAVLAMMAPPNQLQVLSTLAELSNAQGLATNSSAAQPAIPELPAAMRSMLDSLMRKFCSDKSFLQSVIIYATEQLKDDGQGQENSLNQDELLRFGLDGLKTLPAALAQIVNERKHYQMIITRQDALLDQLTQTNNVLAAATAPQPAVVHNLCNPSIPHVTSALSLPTIASANQPQLVYGTNPYNSLPPNITQTISPSPQPDLNPDGSIKNNPEWVCLHVMFDGSGLLCHGINQDWYKPRDRRGGATRWTLRQNCVKCFRPNNANRRYLNVQHPMGQSPPIVQQPMVQSMPYTALPVIFTGTPSPPKVPSPLTFPSASPPVGTPNPNVSAVLPPSRKRKAPEAIAPSSPPKKPHPGYAIAPATQSTIRRELPQKEWMLPKQKEAVTEQVVQEESGTPDSDLASLCSLFGEDEEVADDAEFEADLMEALDDALSHE